MNYLLLLALVIGSNAVNAVESIHWDKSAINLELTVGVEQLIHFESNGDVYLTPLIADQNIFRTLFASNTVYWKALQPFDTQRVRVVLGEETVLFDISAKTVKKPPKSVEPLKLIMGLDEPEVVEVEQSRPDAVTMFDMLRYAAQIDYAPARVVKPVLGIHQVETTRAELSPLYSDPRARTVDMFVKHAWEADGLFVTGIVIRNRTNLTFRFDPSKFQHTATGNVNAINNRFLASAMVNRFMGHRGSKRDQSMLYIVTNKPFSDVINLGENNEQ